MEFNYFDLVASIIILLLGLKGIINGFFKEVFGLVGIVGGIFVASRVGNDVGKYLSDLIFNFENSAAINFTGFLATLAVFWLTMLLLGTVFKKLSSMSGLGPIDRFFGFVVGASKFFLIAAVIANSAYNMKSLKPTLDEKLETSKLFPILVETGSFIMKINPNDLSDKINDTTKQVQDSVTETVKKTVQEQIVKPAKEMAEEAK